MRANNYGCFVFCRLCGDRFLKTKDTGNLCRGCRRRKLRPGGKKIDTKVFVNEFADMSDVVEFIERIERRSGFLNSLVEMNELFEMWNRLGKHQYLYDTLPTGHQLYHMWMDLKKWKSSYLEKNI